jgi:uncharacterized membrane protein
MKPARGRRILSVFFVVAGVMHFVIPASYTKIMPVILPFPLELVLISGALEIAGGVGLLMERTRRVAAFGLVALLVAVWPANVQMLLNARQHDAAWWYQLLLWIRLPVQIPLIWWTWRVGATSQHHPLHVPKN